MKKLQLKEMGCKGTGYRNGSDLPNCRLRANFTDVNGLEVCCDFGGWQRRDAGKKGCPVVQKMRFMSMDATMISRAPEEITHIFYEKKDSIFQNSTLQKPESLDLLTV